MFKTHAFRTDARQTLLNITDAVQAAVEESGVQEGMCFVYCPHSTAGLTINSYLDPATPQDITAEIDRIVPTRVDFIHLVDTPSDAAGHIKSTLAGVHESIIIHEGQLMLGRSQGVLFAEFDGPRDRRVYIKVMKDPA